MRNLNARYLGLMLATVLGFRGQAPTKQAKSGHTNRYPNGFNKSREEARRRQQIEARAIGYWAESEPGQFTRYIEPGRFN